MNYYNYFTEIEDHFVRRRGKHMWVSPMDWSLIATWRDAGVPLHVALRGIDIAMDTWHSKPHRASDRLSTLFYCHDGVMAEYERHLESHLGEDQQGGDSIQTGDLAAPEKAEGPDRAQITEFLQLRIAEINALRAKQSSCDEIDRVLARLEEILSSVREEEHPDSESLERDLCLLEELLISGLRSRVPEEQAASWGGEAKSELKVYKKRLPKETYQKIMENFLRGKIHTLFHVGELSLFRL